MFYSEYVLAKKGPLGKVWLAAHWSKKLTRVMISRADVVEACESIIRPAAPLALRTSGHLLLGVVKIHDSKQKSLMSDCSDALIKIKLAFRPGVVDLPAGSNTAAFGAITLTENFHDFEHEIPGMDLEAMDESMQLVHVSRAEEITLQEDRFAAHLIDIEHGFGAADAFGADVSVPFVVGHEEGRAADVEVGREGDVSMEPPNESFLGNVSAADKSGVEFGDEGRREMFGDDFMEFREEAPAIPFPVPDTPQLLVDVEPAVQTPVIRLARKKRKLVVDAQTEISGATMRQALEPSGPDDITRTPHDYLGPFAFDRPLLSRRAQKRRQFDEEGIDMLLNAPANEGGSALLALYQRNAVPVSLDRVRDEAAATPAKRKAEAELEPAQAEPEFQLGEMPMFEGNTIDYEPRADPDMSFGGDRSFGGDAGLDTTVTAETAAAAPERTAAEEEQEEVTAAEYEQANRSRRTKKMVENLRTAFEKKDTLSYFGMTKKQTKRVAASVLFELLVLKTDNVIQIVQDKPFGDIKITATESFPMTA
eukprot:m.130090 g.130090  ORF g.130090 m.130090 type:complete len:536 (+) comp16427_c0_seq1:148-1755(+)